MQRICSLSLTMGHRVLFGFFLLVLDFFLAEEILFFSGHYFATVRYYMLEEQVLFSRGEGMQSHQDIEKNIFIPQIYHISQLNHKQK